MAESSQGNTQGTQGDQGTQGTQTTDQTPTRPDWLPADFWNTQKNEPDIQGLAGKYTELSQRFAKGKEAIIPEVKADVMKEIYGRRPEKPDLYKIEMPKQGPLAERLAKSNLVVLHGQPPADFQKEQGKEYYVVNDGPRLELARQLAHASGLSNDEFMEKVVVPFVEAELSHKSEVEKKTSEQIAANRKLLGENADKRIDYVKGKVKAIAGDKAAEALDLDYLPASGIEAIEKILEKAGEPKFSTGGIDIIPKDAAALRDEFARLAQEKDYYESPSKQARAREISGQIAKIEGATRFRRKA